MKTCLFAAILGVSFASISHATISYDISFTLQTGAPAPLSGSFTYDPVLGFSSFIVDWDGNSYNLTTAANSPTTSGNGCVGEANTAAWGFAILSKSVTGCSGSYGWSGVNISNFLSGFGFEFTQIVQDSITATSVPSAGTANAGGDWTIQ